MDAALRLSQRMGDPAREALLEARAGGGIRAWLDEQGDRGAHQTVRFVFGKLLDIIVPETLPGAEDTVHWTRGLGAALPVVIVRFPSLIVVSLYHGGFPNERMSSWGDWSETSVTLKADDGGAYSVRASKPKSSVKDSHARTAYDGMVRRVEFWAIGLQNIVTPPSRALLQVRRLRSLRGRREHIVSATSFTLEQTRVFRGLDPYGR